jgi:hypothetical protein
MLDRLWHDRKSGWTKPTADLSDGELAQILTAPVERLVVACGSMENVSAYLERARIEKMIREKGL